MRYRNLRREQPPGMVLAGPAKAATATYLRCHDEKASAWPHRARLAQHYGLDLPPP